MDGFSEFLKFLFSSASFFQFIGSVIAGGLLAVIIKTFPRFRRFLLRAIGELGTSDTETFRYRLAELTKRLTQASSDVDGLLAEITQAADERAIAVQVVEKRLAELEQSEAQLQKKIRDLQNVSLPVAEHFAAMMLPGEKRSAWRDYILFITGVVVSIIIQAIFQ